MPLPLIAVGIAAGVTALVAAAAGAGIALTKNAQGKKLALIGPKEAGKSTWKTFLKDGTIPQGYEHTILTETITKDIILGKLKMKVTLNDVSGSSDALNEWKQYSEEADHVFFFVDVVKLENTEYLTKAQRFARQVGLWKEMSADVTLVVSHADFDPDWKHGDYDAVRTRPVVTHLKQLMGANRTIVAALGSTTGCLDFTLRALAGLADAESKE